MTLDRAHIFKAKAPHTKFDLDNFFTPLINLQKVSIQFSINPIQIPIKLKSGF